MEKPGDVHVRLFYGCYEQVSSFSLLITMYVNK